MKFMDDTLKNILSETLIFTNQLAYVENAAGTYEVLNELIPLFRYASREGKWALLEHEISGLENYIKILRIRYANRISFTVPDGIPRVFVQRMEITAFVSTTFHSIGLSRIEEWDIDIRLSIVQNENKSSLIRIDMMPWHVGNFTPVSHTFMLDDGKENAVHEHSDDRR